MLTVAAVPRSALAIRRDSAAASAGWSAEVQMRGAAAAGAAGRVLAGLGLVAGAAVLGGAAVRAAEAVRAGEGVLAGAGLLALAVALAGLGVTAGAAALPGVRAGAGAAAEPAISSAETASAYQGHRPRSRIVITLLGQRKT